MERVGGGGGRRICICYIMAFGIIGRHGISRNRVRMKWLEEEFFVLIACISMITWGTMRGEKSATGNWITDIFFLLCKRLMSILCFTCNKTRWGLWRQRAIEKDSSLIATLVFFFLSNFDVSWFSIETIICNVTYIFSEYWWIHFNLYRNLFLFLYVH